jgi:hypothetical protein
MFAPHWSVACNSNNYSVQIHPKTTTGAAHTPPTSKLSPSNSDLQAQKQHSLTQSSNQPSIHPSTMKLLSMSLALFLGTILVTTDAAPRGLNKDDNSVSLGRFLMGMGNKDSGGKTDDKTGAEDDKTDDCEGLDYSFFAESTCSMLESFENMGSDENRITVDGRQSWSQLCDDFEPINEFVCPTEDAVAAICSAKFPDENPAVQKNWCIPAFEMLEDEERRDDCIKFCTDYVSAARGGCCDIDCFVELSNSGD